MLKNREILDQKIMDDAREFNQTFNTTRKKLYSADEAITNYLVRRVRELITVGHAINTHNRLEGRQLTLF